MTKPTISQHLAVLREAGLITARAAGTSRRYLARQEALRGLRAALTTPGKWTSADDIPERGCPAPAPPRARRPKHRTGT